MLTVQQILTLPVEDLIDSDVQICLAPRDVDAWALEKADSHALTEVGLPIVEISQFIPDAEPGREPQAFGDFVGYHLGILRALDVCLVVRSLEVLGVPSTPNASFAFINSSARQYVESSWRYYWLQREIGDLPTTEETFDTFRAFLQCLRIIDPAIGENPNTSFWPGVIESW